MTPAEQRQFMRLQRKIQAGRACAKKLYAAAESLRKLIKASNASGESAPAADDGRILLLERIDEYAGWLETRYGA